MQGWLETEAGHCPIVRWVHARVLKIPVEGGKEVKLLRIGTIFSVE